jgi:flagellar assembly protein FliH
MAKLVRQAIISAEHITLGTQPETISSEEVPTSMEVIPTLEEVRSQAFQEGYHSGTKEGQRIAEQQMEEMKHHLQDILSSIPQAIKQNRMDLHTEIADILLLIIQQYFIEQQNNPEALQAQINQILGQLNQQQSIELHLPPEAIKILQNGRIQLDSSHLNNLKVKADEALVLGGCIVKTDHGVFDASIETRIERLKELLVHIKQGRQHACLD